MSQIHYTRLAFVKGARTIFVQSAFGCEMRTIRAMLRAGYGYWVS